MKFSIVVAAYNVADYLSECITSLANQKFQSSDYEILIIDDGSTDGVTGELCYKLASKYKMVRTIHQDNGGLSAARNTGIKHSKGEFILFVDGDDFWSNLEFLDNLSRNIDTYKSDVVIFSYDKYYGKDESVRIDFNSVPESGNIEENVIDLVRNSVLTAPAWNKCIRRNLFVEETLDFPVGFLSEDCLYCSYLLKLTAKYSILNIESYKYRQNRIGSITNVVKEKNVYDILKSIDIGLTNIGEYKNNVRKAINIYFAISYISVLPYVSQYISNSEIMYLLKKYKYLLKFSNEIKNRSFNLTGKITRILGLRLSIILLPKLLRIYKTM